ncbi:unnamed protein product [Sphagnum jensenii]
MGVVTFVSLLSTCSHAGLVDGGLVYFDSMGLVHDVSPTVEHYACMVDLFGCAGHLHEAEELIKTMSFEPNAPVWKALKQPWCTWIELNKGVHSFTVDDQEHLQIIEICAELKRLSGQMKDLGYVPDIKFLLHDVEDEDKMLCLGHHSENPAIAFALISTPPEGLLTGTSNPGKVLKTGPSLGGGGHRTRFLILVLLLMMLLRELEQRRTREGEEVFNNGGELERQMNLLSLEGEQQQQQRRHLLDADLKGST